MAIPLTINGAVFEYPQNFDEEWGIDATGWAQAVTAGMLSLSGGNFPLTNTVDFGASFGIKVKSILTETVNPSTGGYIALARTDTIGWRNTTNSANLLLAVNSSNVLTFNGSALGLTSLADSHIYVGNSLNVPIDVALSGDATLADTGTLTISNSAITDAKVSASAGIVLSKLAATTVSRAIVSDSGGVLSPSVVTSTELGFISGLTSNVQAQIGTLLPLAGGAMSGAISMASHKITALANGSNAGDAVAFNQVHLLQGPIFSSESTGGTTASTSFVDKGVTATITPTSTSSTIFIIESAYMTNNASNGTGILGVSSSVNGDLYTTTSSPGRFHWDLQTGAATVTVFAVDAPGTLSPVTYKMRLASNAAGGNAALIGGAAAAGSLTTMILFEVI